MELRVHRIPHSPNVERVALAQSQTTDGKARRTLLYVEENPANLELVEQIIARRKDLRMLSAAEGSIGIEFARAYQPDVILMDINLPGISGLEAMQILLADPTTAHIPIIIVSSSSTVSAPVLKKSMLPENCSDAKKRARAITQS